MITGYLFLINLSLKEIIATLAGKFDNETLGWVIFFMAIPYFFLLAALSYRKVRTMKPFKLSRLYKSIKLVVHLEKDKPLRPQVLTMTIRNTGKHEADIDAPVLEFRKIWTKRKFKLNGINGNAIYPMYINPGSSHQLRIETATFHQYDRTIKSFYWARIVVTDVDGRTWKSNTVKLRKSLVT